MQITLTNLSNEKRSTVATVTVPTESVATYGTECTFVNGGRVFRAVKCKTQGAKTVFRIFTKMAGNETLTGELINSPVKDIPAYQWHDWIADDWTQLVPEIGVTVGTTTTYESVLLSFKVVEASAAHQRCFMRTRHIASGLIFEFWVDINHNDPVIPFWGKIVWSDRQDKKHSRTFKEIFIRCGERLVFDSEIAHGIRQLGRVDSKWVALLGTDLPFIDGSGLPISGSMLGFVNFSKTLVQDQRVDVEESSANLIAASQGPVLGVARNWNNYWLANLYTPRTRMTSELVDYFNSEWIKFMDQQQVSGTWFTTRQLGIGKNPGATGDQEDFAATKGTAVITCFRPEHIKRYQYSVYADIFRGFMFYEADGTPLDYKNHPNWVTWSGVTHYHVGVSPDRLGKDPNLAEPIPATGFIGYDDEHRSQNNLAAYAALTDDPLADDIIEHILNTDMASYRMRYPTYGSGAARAQGRCAGTWANFFTIGTPKAREYCEQLLHGRWIGLNTNPDFSPLKAVPVIGMHGPDGRKPIFDINGNLLPTWSIWEHALSAVGFYNAFKIPLQTSSTDANNFYRLIRTIAQNGCFEQDGAWYFVDDMWYNNGEPIPEVLSKQNRYITYSQGGVGSWTLAALLIAAKILPEGDPLKAKAKACCNYYTVGEEAVNLFQSEWWAIVDKV